ncbi:MAG: O-antigen ligase family protein [Actinomycetota bacterium]
MPLIAFFFVAVLSSLQSIHPLTSILGQYGRWEGLLTISCYLILYLTAHKLAERKELLNSLHLSLLASSLTISTIAIIEHFWTNPFLLFAKTYCPVEFSQPNAYDTSRSIATFGNATFLAAYLAIVLPIIFSYSMFMGKTARLRVLSYLSLFFTLISLLLTLGRAAWLGAFAGIVLILWLSWSRAKRFYKHATAVAIIFALAFAIMSMAGYAHPLKDRFASIFKVEGSTLTRIQIWRSSLPLISENPLLGSGPDTFKYVFGKYKPEGWVQHLSDPQIDRAHSDILQTTITQGILGLLVYLWLSILIFWLGIKKAKPWKNSDEFWIVAGMLGSAFAYITQLQFNFSHFSTAPLFWIILGIVTRLLFTSSNSKIIATGISRRQRPAAIALISIMIVVLATWSILPLEADIHFERGRSLEAKGKLKDAITEYTLATTINGYEPIYKVSLAKALIQSGIKIKNKESIDLGSQVFSQAKQLNPLDEHIYFSEGDAYLNAGRSGWPSFFEKSIESLYRGLELNPVMVDAYIDIGIAYAYLRNYDEAINAWNDALAIEPNNDKVYFNLGWVYEQKGERKLAKKAYLKAFRLNPQMIEARVASDRL